MYEQIDASLSIKTVPPPEGDQSFCLRVSGHLSGERAHILRKAIEPVFISPNPPTVRLIMDDVKYMDSTGVGVIVAIIQQMRRYGGRLEISGLTDVGRQLFHILKLTKFSECVLLAEQND